MKKRNLLLSVCLCICLGGCSNITVGAVNIASSTTFFEKYSAERTEESYNVKGTVHQMKADHNGCLAQVKAQNDTVIHISGTLSREKGNLELIYEAPDKTQILIADADTETLDQDVPVKKGSGAIRFEPAGEDAVYDFKLQMSQVEGVRYGGEVDLPELPLPEETLPALESDENREKEELPDIGEPDSPILEDDWPEKIGREDEGMTAHSLSFIIPIEEPVTLRIDCTTDSGSLNMRIVDVAGKVYFDEKKISTQTYEVEIDRTGNYQVIIDAERHVGSFWISPLK